MSEWVIVDILSVSLSVGLFVCLSVTALILEITNN